ncbi:MAG: conjugal transfer protein TraG N-terminal domain-containing protein [Proteobacteria bacterium]|nr:conjugal transfer protein TraG N-terminal domain-containing protein [Pseudomonadota bacterium]MCG2744516.1 conjugal transfer protein TraG N-terminal domain-containing protein [Desulfobacteraceae bacterium]MBU4028475.1 conjugal transfer protein TraG N-terminal domain-containing protein [Pseudomonadota bacterium]MBU4043637.1 conjugal transfer protein TraG N-terminal domain-containing protein [Pseudomonadota bacterium]MBU4166894.1 conjugal transfer protein TraG N-terminal domain-containing prot
MKKTAVTLPAILFLAFLFVALFQATPAYAMDMEYYTYGGFGPITQAFTRLALIFSDAGYIGLFTVVTVLGFLAGAISWLVQAANGGKATPLIWAVPVIFGVVLYLGLFVPKGNITVYDPTLNRFQTIGGIPDAVVFAAGVLNKVERGLVEIIDTASAPDSEYSRGAGGIGFKTLESVRNSYIKDNHLRTSTIRYTKDCVTFELMRPGTTLSLDTLRNDATDFLTELGNAANPAIYTVYYDSANPAGVTKTCTEAWNLLRPIYQNPNNYNEALRKTCGKASFDSNNALEYNTCKDLITSTLRFTTGDTVVPEKLVQQRQISEILYTFYYQEDVETAMLMEANRKITSQGVGVGIAMNEWIPIIKAIMTAIAIGMIPFLALFLPTPVVGKALSAMFGFFCFLTIWGITDAVVHTAAMDYAAYAFEEMRQSSLGVYSMAAFPSLSEKMLGMFGIIRSSGIMLASLFTMMLIKFGGHALAMMAGSLSGAVSGAGGQSGALLTPEGTASAMSQQIKASGNLEGMPQHRFSNQASAEAFNSVHSPVGGYNSSMNARRALEQSGQIPKGTSDAGYAEMQKNFNQQAGTASGQSSVSLGPNGQATQGQTKSVNADGSTSMTTSSGAGGVGVQTDSMAAGQATYATDGNGGTTLTKASVNGMSPIAMAHQAAYIKTKGAGDSLATNENWANGQSYIKNAALTSSEARTYGENLNNSVSAKLNKAINSGSSFKDSVGEDTTAKLLAFAEASGGLQILGNGATGGGRYDVTATGKDGRTVSFDVDQKTSEAIGNEITKARSEALQESMGSSQGLTFANNLAHNIGATKASSLMNDARDMQRSTETTGADLSTAFVGHYATERYGSDSPENVRKATDALNHMATGGATGIDQLNGHINSFLKNGAYSWGDGKTQVSAAISAAGGQVEGQVSNIQEQVGPAVGESASHTSRITPGDFSGNPGVHHAPLVGPGEITGHVNATADQRLHEHQDAKLMGPNGALVDNLTGVNIPAGIKDLTNNLTGNKKVVAPEDTSEPGGEFSGP